jgi:hypothetical protein
VYWGGLDLNLNLFEKWVLILLCNFIKSMFYFLSIDIAFGKLVALKSVTSAYQGTTVLNTLSGGNWENY